MNVPKTPSEFDYDLWKTEDGKYMARVKATEEVCEIDADTMRFLRAEEKRLRRSYTGCSQTLPLKEPVLSLDSFNQEIGDSLFPPCLESQGDLEKIVMANILVERFLAELTPKQLGVYKNCILGGKNFAEYGKELGFTRQDIHVCITAIRKKAKKFLSDT